MRFLVLPSLIVTLLAGTGCRALRFDVGFGFGVGVHVKLPAILHTGAGLGKYYRVGHAYAEGWHAGTGRKELIWDFEISGLLYHDHHALDVFWEAFNRARRTRRHFCFLVPALMEPDNPDSYALEVGVQFFVLEIWLGFNPYYLFHDEPSAESEFQKL